MSSAIPTSINPPILHSRIRFVRKQMLYSEMVADWEYPGSPAIGMLLVVEVTGSL
jgi:hypothetical protein